MIEAVGDNETKQATGTLEIVRRRQRPACDRAFDIHPALFTPNQDGIRDRTNINVYLEKPAALNVYLEDADGLRNYLIERESGREPGDAGNHEYDYDGGVDQDLEPPADGLYTVYAVAQDDEGQRIVRESALTIQNGGLPRRPWHRRRAEPSFLIICLRREILRIPNRRRTSRLSLKASPPKSRR